MEQILIAKSAKEIFSDAFSDLYEDNNLGLQFNGKLAKFMRRFIIKNRNSILDFVNCSAERLRRDYKIKETKVEAIIQLQHKVIEKYGLTIVPSNP